jgi:hypothetical protein
MSRHVHAAAGAYLAADLVHSAPAIFFRSRMGAERDAVKKEEST